MRFDAPAFAFLLLLVPALVALYAYGFRRRRRALAVFLGAAMAGGPAPGGGPLRRWLKAACLVAAAGLLVIGLMRPETGEGVEEAPRRGRDLIFLLDVSRSMLAEDATPNRLEAAKAGIAALIEELKAEGGHRLGLVAFAGHAVLRSPVTLDYGFFLERLAAADTTSAKRRGSRIGDAIGKALSGIDADDAEYTDLILISDGEDHGSLPLNAAQAAAFAGVSVHAVGVGDAVRGARIPLADDSGPRRYLSEDGKEVVSRLREPLLRQLADLTQGAYLPAASGPVALAPLYRQTIAVKRKREVAVSASARGGDLYQWLVLAAVLLLGAEALIGERPPAREGTHAGGLAPAAAAIMLLMLAGFARSTDPYDAVEEGNALYRFERYGDAAERYAAALDALPDSPVVQFNMGIAHLQLGDYATAAQAFARALDTDEARLAALAYYNLGNVRYRQALAAMPALDEAESFLGQAMAPYRASLAFDPGFADAMYNLELAYRLLDEIAGQRGQAPDSDEEPDPGNPGRPSQNPEDLARGPGGGDQPDQDQAGLSQPGQSERMTPERTPPPREPAQGNPGVGGRFNMTVEEAEDIIEFVRGLTREAESQRRQRQDARMRDPDIERPW
jgi:Ca-activated chloride channel family protein